MVERYTSKRLTYLTVHRIIPAGPKHGLKTACGIKLAPTGIPGYYSDADNGGQVSVTEKGIRFDCERCDRVLRIRHANEGFNIGGRE